MTYATTPRKVQRTSTGKRRRGKSQPRRLFASGPTRTFVSKQGLPEIKRLDEKISFSDSNSFVAHACFSNQKGTANDQRIGNTLNMKALKIFYDFGLSGISSITDPTATFYEQNVYVVRDTEPHSTPPNTVQEWTAALFGDASNYNKWGTQFRNTDYVDRFQIVKKIDVRPWLVDRGSESNHGYLHVPLNGVQAKYETGLPESTVSAPINTRYYVLSNVGLPGIQRAYAVVNIREEWTD